MKKTVLVAAVVLLSLSGCSVSQQMDMRIDGSGEVRLTVDLDRVFQEYYRDLSGGDSLEESGIFDTDEITRVLQQQSGLQVDSVTTPQPGRLDVTVRLQDIEQLFRDDTMAVPEVITFSRSANRATVRIRVGRTDLPRFLRLSPIGDSPMIEYLLPPGNSLSRSEYIEYLSWALEEYEGNVPIAHVIESAAIELRIRPAGDILVQRGGEVDGDTVVFRIPVIDLVLADSPLEYSLQFRAE
ncbi:hypothetical protein [Spirochaeta africana]|uniref:Lipoprotein n=1 Tax=Spirochaeta africana (strain ATCC 700263 / DSM 8902 / Z-7692) TaxID=889378 RepID=H9UFS6_SPIAZ|nr:hypothetical protein [Spirochaeta africana]AFG36369.1 hypothetical protein Spiaf_0261 [Spirochaeta africana DSM 8902]